MTMATHNSTLITQNSPAFGRSCVRCDCGIRPVHGRDGDFVCANHPDYAGQIVLVVSTGEAMDDVGARCREFRMKTETAASPPPPAGDSVRYIDLTGGFFATVDAADYEWLSQYTWRVTGGYSSYACCKIANKTVYMHRLIMNPPPGKVVDHSNGNRWDNRRDNLRICTQAENLQNRRKSRGTSQFKGVFWHTRRRKWQAVIGHQGKTIQLGFFTDEIEAAKAYDRAALERFGPFARLNFPHLGRIVLLKGHGRFCRWVLARRNRHVRKSQMPISKSQTRPKSEIQMTETPAPDRSLFGVLSFGLSRLFGPWSFGFGICPAVGPRGPP
jgi:hypothetical protein